MAGLPLVLLVATGCFALVYWLGYTDGRREHYSPTAFFKRAKSKLNKRKGTITARPGIGRITGSVDLLSAPGCITIELFWAPGDAEDKDVTRVVEGPNGMLVAGYLPMQNATILLPKAYYPDEVAAYTLVTRILNAGLLDVEV